MAGNSRGSGQTRDKAEELASSASQAASSAASQAREAAASATQKAGDAASNLTHKAQEVASNLGQKAQDVASNLGQRAQDVASGVGDRTEDALSAVGQGMSNLAGTIRQRVPQEGMLGTTAGRVADQLEAGAGYLQEHGLNDIAGDVGQVVRQYPVASLVAVFGFGFLLGSAMRR